MADLERIEDLVSSVEFECNDQTDLVKMIRLTDPRDSEVSLTLQANMSERMQELYSKITDSSGGINGVNPNYGNVKLNLSRRVLPLDNPQDILPPGILAFIKDLDEFITLSKRERIIPFLGVLKKEDQGPKIEQVRVSVPRITNKSSSPYISGLNRKIEDELYTPRLAHLRSIGALIKGRRPGFITYLNVRDPDTVNDCWMALDTVPRMNRITYLKIGARPRDEGRGEYYHWRCSAVMQMFGEKTVRIEFDEPTDANALERDLRKQGVNITLEGR